MEIDKQQELYKFNYDKIIALHFRFEDVITQNRFDLLKLKELLPDFNDYKIVVFTTKCDLYINIIKKLITIQMILLNLQM